MTLQENASYWLDILVTAEGASVTITLEIKPEVEAELVAQAAARGMDVSAYAASLLEQAAKPAQKGERELTLSEFLMQSPLAGSGINVERDKDPGRNIDL